MSLSVSASSESPSSEVGPELLGPHQPNDRENAPELHVVAHRVHQEFDGRFGARAIDECLERVAARFIGARVHSFVPLLVYRYVREELQASLRQARSDLPQ